MLFVVYLIADQLEVLFLKVFILMQVASYNPNWNWPEVVSGSNNINEIVRKDVNLNLFEVASLGNYNSLQTERY